MVKKQEYEHDVLLHSGNLGEARNNGYNYDTQFKDHECMRKEKTKHHKNHKDYTWLVSGHILSILFVRWMLLISIICLILSVYGNKAYREGSYKYADGLFTAAKLFTAIWIITLLVSVGMYIGVTVLPLL